MHIPTLLIVSATRVGQTEFRDVTPLGRSLRRLSYDPRVEVRVQTDNRHGLPLVYNRQISNENREKVLLFAHDDIWLDDCFVYERLQEALRVFDVIGVAGNTRRLPRQPGWAFATEQPLTWDDQQYLSGVVSHGPHPCGEPNRYGQPPGEPCLLLDGVFLAVLCQTLLTSGVRFDERFMFDFYDLDFCRSAERAGLRMGTWPIAITHTSVGQSGSPAWRGSLQTYREKWVE